MENDTKRVVVNLYQLINSGKVNKQLFFSITTKVNIWKGWIKWPASWKRFIYAYFSSGIIQRV